MTLREYEKTKIERNRLFTRGAVCKNNISPKFFEPYCLITETMVTIGDKCPFENKKSVEPPCSSKEKSKWQI